MAALKNSANREAILMFLQERTDHPTADVVFRELREINPTISLGTVYRNLNQLADTGRIARLLPGDGKEHYDWRTAPHEHFFCRGCGALLDMPTPLPDNARAALLTSARYRFDGIIEGCAVIFTGLCSSCAEDD